MWAFHLQEEMPVINVFFLLSKVRLSVTVIVVGITTCSFWYYVNK